MSNMDFIISTMHLPEDSLKLIDDRIFVLTLPVQPNICPHCHAICTKAEMLSGRRRKAKA